MSDLHSIKKSFQNLVGADWIAEHENDVEDDEDKYDLSGRTLSQEENLYNFDHLQIDQLSPVGAVSELFLYFIENYLNLQNANQIGIGVEKKQQHVLKNAGLKHEYEQFLRFVQSIANNFNAGFQSKIENYVCFSGPREEKQLMSFMTSQFNNAKEELKFFQESRFKSTAKLVVLRLLQKLLTLYKKENQMIIDGESKVGADVRDKICAVYSGEIAEYRQEVANNPSLRFEDIRVELFAECLNIFKRSMEYEERINQISFENSLILRQSLEKIPVPPVKPVKFTHPNARLNHDIEDINHLLMLHLDSRTHKIRIAALNFNRDGRSEVVELINKTGEFRTIGIVGHSVTDDKFYYGIEAIEKQKYCGIELFDLFDLFTLLCYKSNDPYYYSMALKNFFFQLKIEIENVNNRNFNHAVLILPDWMKPAHEEFLIAVLKSDLFPRVTLKKESDVVAEAHFQQSFEDQRRIRNHRPQFPHPLLIIMESFGFVHVKIVLGILKIDNRGKTSTSTFKATVVDNEKWRISTPDSDVFSRWKWNRKSNIFETVAPYPDISTTDRFYHEACNIFEGHCREGYFRNWTSHKMDCVMLTDNLEWRKEIWGKINTSGRTKLNLITSNWNDMALQGAAFHQLNVGQFV